MELYAVLDGIFIALLLFVFLALGDMIQEVALFVSFSVELDDAYLPWLFRDLDELNFFWNIIKDISYCWEIWSEISSAECFDIAIFT